MTTPLKVKVSKKAPKNDAALKSLKDQGYHVKIEHFRRNYFNELVPDKVCSDKFGWLLINVWNLCYAFDVTLTGGATKMILVKDENKIEIVSTCYWKDRFCRKHGVKACLEKLEKDYNIKA
jgi:hypothetical protein